MPFQGGQRRHIGRTGGFLMCRLVGRADAGSKATLCRIGLIARSSIFPRPASGSKCWTPRRSTSPGVASVWNSKRRAGGHQR
jgi:hypothetical protein